VKVVVLYLRERLKFQMSPKIELQIYCAVCGTGLCEQTKVERSIKLFVEKIVQELATKFGVSTRLIHDVVYRGYRVKKDE
jgi:hypothetical protein